MSDWRSSSRMNKLDLACSVISKTAADHIIERLKRKNGKAPERPFVREAFLLDRERTAMHEAAHAVVGFLFGESLAPEGVRIRDPRPGVYTRGGVCAWSPRSGVTVTESVIRLQAGHLAEAFVDDGVVPITADEVAEALSWLDTSLAMATLWKATPSDIVQALRDIRLAPGLSKDEVISTFMTHQEWTGKLIRIPQVSLWIWRVGTALQFADDGVLSDAQAREAISDDISALSKTVLAAIRPANLSAGGLR